MSRWGTAKGPFGTILQSSVPSQPRMDTAGRAYGLTLRGVVTGVYVYDSEEGYNGGKGTDNNPINTIYVDIMCYGTRFNGRLPRVLWTHDRSGMHEGPVTIPRAATKDVTGDLDLNSGSNPANWDGDHVIIGFLEDDLGQPFVMRSLPHPSSDIGNDSLAPGHRMRLKGDDGITRMWKHQGAVFGADKAGNWLVDLRRAHTGDYKDTGAEPAQAKNGSVGNATFLVPEGSKFKIGVTKSDQTADSQDPNPDTNTTEITFENNKVIVKIDGGTPQTLTMEGGALTLANTGDTTLNTDGAVHLGTGASHPVIHGDTYQTDMNTMNPQVSAHFQGILALATALTTAGSAPPGSIEAATIPTLWAAILAFANGLATTGTTAGTAITTFDAAIAAQLSSDVDAK